MEPLPVSHRIANQDRGLYRWPSGDRLLFYLSDSASRVSESPAGAAAPPLAREFLALHNSALHMVLGPALYPALPHHFFC